MVENNLKNKDNIFEITPDTSLWMKLGKTKYTIPKALSELIDNSIDSRLGNKVKVDIYFQIGGDYLGVLDNGSGMSRDDLKLALTIAHHNNGEKQIGEYGFGLKSATSYLGKKLYIYTKTKDMDKYIKFYYDENEFINKKEWNVEYEFIDRKQVQAETEVDFDHGTYILVKDLNVKLYKRLTISSDKTGVLIPKFRRIYRLLLQNDILELTLHPKTQKGNIAEPIKIQPYEFDRLTTKINFSFLIKHNNRELNIKGWAGILPILVNLNPEKNKDIYKYNGFQVYKNYKIILENELIGYNFHPEKRLILGEIGLDDFETLNNKSDFVRNNDWQVLEKIIRVCVVNPLASISNSKFINQFKMAYNHDGEFLGENTNINHKLNDFILNIENKQLNDKESELNLEINPFEIIKYNIDIDCDVFNKYIEYIKLERSTNIYNIEEKHNNENQKDNLSLINDNNQQINKELRVSKSIIKDENLKIINEHRVFNQDYIIHSKKEESLYFYDFLFDNINIIHKYETIEESNDDFIYSNDEDEVLTIISNKKNYDYKLETEKNYCIDNIINAVVEYKIINIHKQISLDRELLRKLRRECSIGIKSLIN
ncbi:ATP-binding protein [Turicibacter bilis]|uniref:ATP-binding protein n=1 Tax=Turicibacter bilis TaxID=2735723 RepID=UPI0031BACCA2